MDYFENQSLDAKDMHPEYRRAEEAYRAEAARLWESEQRIREGIRAQTDLTDEERQERYMAAYEDLNGRFERLANGFASDVHKRLRADRQKLEKGAGERFGEYLISLSSRDADELPALMETARRTGQEDLERAVAQVALDKGRLGVFQEWAERNPERGEAYRRLKSTPSAGQLRTRALVLQCHFDLGYESATSSSELEHPHYPLPESLLAPLAIAPVDRPPRSELFFRQISPRSAGPENPQHPAQNRAVIAPRPSRGRLLRWHKGLHELPLLVGQTGGGYRC